MTERQVESVLIEIPKGSRNKYEYDKEKKVIKYDRMLSSSMVYPSDYPKNDPMWNYIETTDQVPPHLFKEITHFFQNYKKLEGKHVNVFGWKGLETAVDILQEAKARYIEQKKQ